MAATLKDVSAAAGVATATVSYVLSGKVKKMKISEKTANRVLAAARKLNYRTNLIAKNLRQRTTHTIGIVLNDLSSSWANEVMDGLNGILFPAGYQPLLGITFYDSEREQKIINTFLDSQVEALVIQPLQASSEFYREIRKNTDIPILFVGESIESLSFKAFMIDGFAAGYDQVAHLYSLGHRKIALLTSDNLSVQSNQRIEGANAKIRELGLAFPDGYLRTTRKMSPEQDIQETLKLMQLPEPPTAIAVVNDMIAFRVMSALHHLGCHSTAVIGIGDLPESSYDMIGLSTITEPRRKIGSSIGEYLIELLVKSKTYTGEPVLFHGKLQPRKSTLSHEMNYPDPRVEISKIAAPIYNSKVNC